jgi:hypothetical protein
MVDGWNADRRELAQEGGCQRRPGPMEPVHGACQGPPQGGPHAGGADHGGLVMV